MSAHYNYATVNRPTPWGWMLLATCAVTTATAVVIMKVII